jgi:hypothetical protein
MHARQALYHVATPPSPVTQVFLNHFKYFFNKSITFMGFTIKSVENSQKYKDVKYVVFQKVIMYREK